MGDKARKAGASAFVAKTRSGADSATVAGSQTAAASETDATAAASAMGCEVEVETAEVAEHAAFASSFFRQERAALRPMAALLGGIGAQEALKVFFVFSATTITTNNSNNNNDDDNNNKNHHHHHHHRLAGQRQALGPEICAELAKMKLFVIGAGAIGCELLKDFAGMGIALASEGGEVSVTDNDFIERSNLNRQLLFRQSDIGKSKAACAAEACHRLNPSMRGARLLADELSVRYCVPLLDSGTLGAKGSVQPSVPKVTESYGASADPAEEEGEIPQCTLKTFPFAPEHCVAWAREQLDGEFGTPVGEAMRYVCDEEAFVNQYVDDSEAGVDTEALGDALRRVVGTLEARPTSYAQCVRKALGLFTERFDSAIGNILHQFPAAHRDEDGLPFWRGSKHMPVRIPFSRADPSHIAFVRAAARLFAESYGVLAAGGPHSLETFHAALEAALLEQASGQANGKPREMDPARPPAAAATAASAEGGEEDKASLSRLMAEAEALLAHADELRAAVPADSLRPLEFEKDDNGNGHVDFILAASNLRAGNYAIASIDRLACKGLAGRIVPAIATTTAVVASLVCFELLKLARAAAERAAGRLAGAAAERARLRSTFVNLALPLVASTEPLPPTPRALGIGGLEALSEWDELEVDLDAAGGAIGGVVEQLERTLGGARVLSLACGDTVLFSARLRCAFAPDERVADALAKLRPPPHVHAAADGRHEVRLAVTAVRAGDEVPIDAPPVVLRWRAGP
ncbi:hypothetical protein T492DRAFT_1090042 [Pavlovales sp. CCMP2436]|nr:hypothetical protein T492DRAFT_1090042 [Pavlovales sp. CCMP2436]